MQTIPEKLHKDFKLFQIRVFDVCPACDGSGKPPRKASYPCPVCKGLKVVATVLHEGATLDILLAKVFEDASKKKVNEPKETCSRCGQPLGSFPCLCPKKDGEL